MPAASTTSERASYAAVGSFSDPGGSGWTGTVDYGDGSGVLPLSLSGSSFSLQHVYAEPCSCTVVVTITNARGGRAAGTASVTVRSVARTLSVTPAAVAVLGAFSATGSFTDPDAGYDGFSATVDYGDGSGAQPLSLSGTSFTLSHQYATLLATFTVIITVSDDDGAVGTATITVVTAL
jgi:large repetitive protein